MSSKPPSLKNKPTVRILKRETLHSGYLTLERITAVNLGADKGAAKSTSKVYSVEVFHRRGMDCVAIILYRIRGKQIQVAVRKAHRASLAARKGRRLPIADKRKLNPVYEAVAGSLEPGDTGWAGLKKRAAKEVLEETGFVLAGTAIQKLGEGFFPSHGQSTEKLYLTCAEIFKNTPLGPQKPDGPDEEGATLQWVVLETAIKRCVSGMYQDPKLEIGFRRLKDKFST